MDRELGSAGTYEWQWKDVPDRQRWIVAWGVLWRIWVVTLGIYIVAGILFLLFAALLAVGGQ